MPNAPEPKINVDLGDASTEVFMSYGLLNEIVTMVNDIDSVATIGVDHELRNNVLNALLAERDEDGNIVANVNWYKMSLSPEEMNRLIAWVSEHVFDFFLKSFENANSLKEANEERLKKLLSSLDGFSDLASGKPSYGSSE